MLPHNVILLQETCFIANTLCSILEQEINKDPTESTSPMGAAANVIKSAMEKHGISQDRVSMVTYLLEKSLCRYGDSITAHPEMSEQIMSYLSDTAGLDIHNPQAVAHTSYFLPLYFSEQDPSSIFRYDVDEDINYHVLAATLVQSMLLTAAKIDNRDLSKSRADALHTIVRQMFPETMDITKCYPIAHEQWCYNYARSERLCIVLDASPDRIKNIHQLSGRQLRILQLAGEITPFKTDAMALDYIQTFRPNDGLSLHSLVFTKRQVDDLFMMPNAAFAALRHELSMVDLSMLPTNSIPNVMKSISEKFGITLPQDSLAFVSSHLGRHVSLNDYFMDAYNHTSLKESVLSLEPVTPMNSERISHIHPQDISMGPTVDHISMGRTRNR